MRFSLLNEEIPFYTPIEQIFYNRGIPVNEIEHYKTRIVDIDEVNILDDNVKIKFTER